MLRTLLALFAALTLSACHPPTWTRPVREPLVDRAYETPSTRPASAAFRAPTLPLAPAGSVAARLERFEKQNSIQLTTGGGAVRVERRGTKVVSSDGRSGLVITIRPEGNPGVQIGEQLYLGTVLVLPHSQGGITVINHVPMEDYVRGVVARELAIWSATPALLESQAIAARSYAQAQLRGRPGKRPRTLLSDSTLDQAYAGEYLPGEGAGAQKVAARLRRAVEATRHIVLVENGRVLDARFHASCGGRTASFESVFDEADPGGMTPVPCVACAQVGSGPRPASTGDSSSVVWEWTAGPEELGTLARELGIGTSVRSLFPIRRDSTGRWLEVRAVGDRTGHNVDSTALRQVLGFNNLKSTWIMGTRPAPGSALNGQITFAGRGRGHGVGFCQTGARELAERGLTASQILKTYFPTASFSRVSPRPAQPTTKPGALLPAGD